MPAGFIEFASRATLNHFYTLCGTFRAHSSVSDTQEEQNCLAAALTVTCFEPNQGAVPILNNASITLTLPPALLPLVFMLPRGEGIHFGMDERTQPRLLVASISESANRHAKLPNLQLPSFKLAFPGLASPRSPRCAGEDSRGQLHRRGLRGPNPAQLGHDMQRAVALLGGVLLAGITQAAQQVAKARPRAKQWSDLPFHQSFKFPWDNPSSNSRR